VERLKAASRNATIRQLAVEFLKNNDIYAPLDVVGIAHLFGAHIYFGNLPLSVDGFTLSLKDGDFLIGINSFQPETRRRFTICHEYSHIALSHNKIADPVIEEIDREADVFAAELLMPSGLIRHLVEKFQFTAAALSYYFRVSKPAIEIKLKELNLDAERNIKVAV